MLFFIRLGQTFNIHVLFLLQLRQCFFLYLFTFNCSFSLFLPAEPHNDWYCNCQRTNRKQSESHNDLSPHWLRAEIWEESCSSALWGWNFCVGVLADWLCNISLVVHVASEVVLDHFVATHAFSLLEEKGPVVHRARNALSFNKAPLCITVFTGWHGQIISHKHHPVTARNIKSFHSLVWQG